ncbi:MAG: aldehyde dehydrogenase family protein, partial [Planctomycetota bacterium]|nr:aldehyde dehydrogenase family protein [Planctomycetota bacterium]
FAQCPDASRGQLDATLESAQEAFRAWRADPGARRAALVKAGEALQAAAASIGRVLTQDVAK